MAAPDRADGPVPAPARPRTAVTDGAPVVEAAGEDEVRVRVGEREFLVSAACPHRRGRLVFARVNEARLRITCPLHHSSFDLLTGAALSGPTERPLCVREVTGDQPPR